jgi:hypothetical protein
VAGGAEECVLIWKTLKEELKFINIFILLINEKKYVSDALKIMCNKNRFGCISPFSKKYVALAEKLVNKF